MTVMQTEIHPTAFIEDGAQIGQDVVIEAFVYIGANVVIGDRCVVKHHASVEGNTVLGVENVVYPYAQVGGKTHDLKYTGGNPGLKIGDRNTFREYSTVHCATDDGDFTILGNDNVILSYAHIAHDCIIGNKLVMSSNTALAGHVIVEDCVNVGWSAGVHQHCKLGRHSMLGACSKVTQDVPPFMLVDGNPAEVRTVNKVGIERNGFSRDDFDKIRGLFTLFYRSGLNKAQAVKRIEESPEQWGEFGEEFANFYASGSGRGSV